ncbi:MAG: asparagine synthase (glutamine-hydrolyzing), partial [Myxococcota bacterium]
MCGITGLWDPSSSRDAVREAVGAMTHALRHRGPDGDGVWVDPQPDGVALGHARLAILDLSDAGAQPMVSRSERFALTYNGEIYNFRELAASLAAEGVTIRSDCDTEVLLEAIATWGLPATLARVVGMFAFALWDRQQRTLTLARDRLGIKPLYVRCEAKRVVFASELGPLLGGGGFQPRLDRTALQMLLRYAFVPTPWTILEGVEKLAPGTFCELAWDEGVIRRRDTVYWSAPSVAERAQAQLLDEEDDALVERVQTALDRSVSDRTVADVPLGALLSGGIDSAAVVCALRRVSDERPYTFTVANDDARYDEAEEARQLAKTLDTEHIELRVEPADLLSVVAELPRLYTEPFADYSQIPTVAVCRRAREHVTVVLTGDGGDELFAGYNRHRWVPRLDETASSVPRIARTWLGRGLAAVPAGVWHGVNRAGGARVPRLMANKMRKLAAVIGKANASEIYNALVSVNEDAAGFLRQPASRDHAVRPRAGDVRDAIMLADTEFYLPDDILTKLDRASMSVGLEGRVPLLDHRLFELAWRL